MKLLHCCSDNRKCHRMWSVFCEEYHCHKSLYMVGGGRRPARTNEGAASMQKAVVQCIVQDGR